MFFLSKKKDRESGSSVKAGAGFTLIELLVVIVIIGLLAAIVLINLGNSRDRGKDAGIQSSLVEVAKAAELIYNDTYEYDGVCDATNTTLSDNEDFGRIKAYITRQGGEISCRDDNGAYVVISSMHLIDCWCVDSNGASKEVVLGGGETCLNILGPADRVCP